jgi:NitT/TauT family transport system substrate-binding protein
MNAFRRLPGTAAATVALLCAFAGALPAQADDALSIVAGNPAPGIFDTLELIAAGAGFYRREHLEVTKNYAANPSTAAQLVATGKADLAATNVEPILTGYEKGLRLQFIISRQLRYSYVLAVPADSPIKTLGDFKGALLGETTAGAAAEIATQSMLAGVGLRPSDYGFVPIGVGAQALSAITAKRVDGVAFPYLEVVNDSIAGNMTFRVFRHPLVKDVGNVGYCATPAAIQAKADVFRRFARAIVEAAVFVRSNPAAAAALYLRGSGQHVTPDAIERIRRILIGLENDLPAADPLGKRIGYFDPRGVTLYSTILAQYGVIKAPLAGSLVVTNQFIPYANDFDRRAAIAFAKRFPAQ